MNNDKTNKYTTADKATDTVIRNVTVVYFNDAAVTEIDTHIIPVGLNEEVVRYISTVKGEPEWLLDFRLKA